MERLMRIGELGERHGLSTATLRYYERLGLLGSPERSGSGYRMFTPDDDARLRFILRGKALDLSLEEIGSLLEAWHQGQCSETRVRLRHLVAHKIREAHQRASEAEAFASQLTHVYDRLGEQGEHGGDCGCIPELPAAVTTRGLEAELALIEHALCSCGGRLDSPTDCACGCCAQTATAAKGGEEMSDQTLTTDKVATSQTCSCCSPAQAGSASDQEAAPSGCTCGTGTSGESCGPGCDCGSGA